MTIEIKVPSLGESVVEATVAKWYKNEGDAVALDEPLLELETDKVTLEVPAPSNGRIEKISASEGSTVEVGAILGLIDENASAQDQVKKPKSVSKEPESIPEEETTKQVDTVSMPEITIQNEVLDIPKLSPAVRKISAEKNIDINNLVSSREDGRITKADVLNTQNVEKLDTKPQLTKESDEREERVPMSRLRQTIAKRLKDAQNNAAMLTTFNEVDMGELIKTRNDHKSEFEKKYGIKLGFMSFFVKACITALRDIPEVNAEIEETDVIYKNFYNIGVAVGTDQGLVVPVVKNADQKSLVEIEKEIYQLGQKARSGQLSIDEMQGGTFTISNGGVYGSLMSTPILNPPQSGILGMHKIEERPIVISGEIVARPMMYLALSYDHRIVDGKGAVTFLVRVKESLEDPSRILLGV
jgi:2-oxoglutarate dehydrogenase E2 component (dihydrolipoamide succinyltransferase)